MPRVSSLTGIPMFVVTNVAAVIISWYLTQRDIWPVKTGTYVVFHRWRNGTEGCWQTQVHLETAVKRRWWFIRLINWFRCAYITRKVLRDNVCLFCTTRLHMGRFKTYNRPLIETPKNAVFQKSSQF